MKENKHFHVCRTKGQNFTHEEYCEAISNLSSKTVIHSFGGFDFNFWDVCLNPEIVVEYTKGCYFFRVSICQSDNMRWSAGYDYWFNNGGACSGPSYSSSSYGYSSRMECIYETLKKLSIRLERSIEDVLAETNADSYDEESGYRPGNKKRRLAHLRACQKEMNKYLDLYDYKQLLLFD